MYSSCEKMLLYQIVMEKKGRGEGLIQNHILYMCDDAC